MPYIKQEDKKLYEPELNTLRKKLRIDSKGDLTYLVYSLGIGAIKRRGRGYANISEVISCLNDAAAELRRRELAPYEDKKMEENGDVE